MMVRGTRRAIAGLLMLGSLAGCGQAASLNGLQSPLPLFTSPGNVDAFGTAASIVSAAFNNTYLERIDLNEPRARQDPGNTDKSLYRVIKRAKSSLEGSFYDIEDLGVADALIAAKQRGVTVRLVTDTDNLVDKQDPSKRREAIARLKAAGIKIVDDQRSAIMHHKFLVADGETVWAGSTNLTPTSLYRHNNNALTIQFPAVAAAFQEEFKRLFEDRAFSGPTRGRSTPFQTAINRGSAQLFFSPHGGGREAVVQEVKGAKKSIRFMTFSLTDVDTGNAMLARAKAGVAVEGVFDRWLAAGNYSLYRPFKSKGLNVWLDGNEALMHHKVIIIDDDTVITGSYNYSQNAEVNNNEAFFIFKGMPGLAKDFTDEFKRLIYAAKHNHPPAVKHDDAEHKTGEGP